MKTTAWSFQGYHITEASFECPGPRDLTAFGVKSKNYKNRNNGLFSFDLGIEFEGEKTKGLLTAECVFRLESTLEIDEENVQFKQTIANMALLVIPYVRQTITALTNDSLKPIRLPTIDGLSLDAVGGTRYVRASPKKSETPSSEKPKEKE